MGRTALIPRVHGAREKKRVADFVRPKFQEMVADREWRDKNTLTQYPIWGKNVTMTDLPRKAVEQHLGAVGFDLEDIEEFVDKRDGIRESIRETERGANALMRDWEEWFFSTLTGAKIAEVVGRRVAPESQARWETARFPRKVFAEITAALIREFFPDARPKVETLRQKTYRRGDSA